MKLPSNICFAVQRFFPPMLDEELGPLSDMEKRFVHICEVPPLERFTAPYRWCGNGRKPRPRLHMARAFAGFAKHGLPEKLHETLVVQYPGEEIIEHPPRTPPPLARGKKPAAKIPPRFQRRRNRRSNPPPPGKGKGKGKGKRGRPPKGREPPAPAPARLERHLNGGLETNLKDMPEVYRGSGCKKNSRGFTFTWHGYKPHPTTGGGDIPLAAHPGANLHDSQTAIILRQINKIL